MDISFDATIRAAAPFQKHRDRTDLMIAIENQDIREKIRIGKVSTACMFVVDASGSMGTEKRMESSKGAVLSLLFDSYQNRDRVGMVAFRGDEAEIVLPICSSVDLALKRLEEIPTGGKTPLSLGLIKGMEALMNEKKKNGEIIPMLILISDGRANKSVSGNIREEITKISEELMSNGIHTVVIDTETVKKTYLQVKLGFCKQIAEISGGNYYSLSDLNSENIKNIAEIEKKQLLLNF